MFFLQSFIQRQHVTVITDYQEIEIYLTSWQEGPLKLAHLGQNHFKKWFYTIAVIPLQPGSDSETGKGHWPKELSNHWMSFTQGAGPE